MSSTNTAGLTHDISPGAADCGAAAGGGFPTHGGRRNTYRTSDCNAAMVTIISDEGPVLVIMV